MVSSPKAQMERLSSLMMVSAHLLEKALPVAPLVNFLPEMVLLEQILLEEQEVLLEEEVDLASDQEVLPSLSTMVPVPLSELVISLLDKTLVVTVLFSPVLPLLRPLLPQLLKLSSLAHSSTV